MQVKSEQEQMLRALQSRLQRFRSSPLPLSTMQPCHERQQAAQEQRRAEAVEARRRELLPGQQPFGMERREEQRRQRRRMLEWTPPAVEPGAYCSAGGHAAGNRQFTPRLPFARSVPVATSEVGTAEHAARRFQVLAWNTLPSATCSAQTKTLHPLCRHATRSWLQSCSWGAARWRAGCCSVVLLGALPLRPAMSAAPVQGWTVDQPPQLSAHRSASLAVQSQRAIGWKGEGHQSSPQRGQLAPVFPRTACTAASSPSAWALQQPSSLRR